MNAIWGCIGVPFSGVRLRLDPSYDPISRANVIISVSATVYIGRDHVVLARCSWTRPNSLETFSKHGRHPSTWEPCSVRSGFVATTYPSRSESIGSITCFGRKTVIGVYFGLLGALKTLEERSH